MANAEGITIAARTERLITSRSGSLVVSHRAAGRGRPGADTGGAAASVISLRPSSRSPVRSANPGDATGSPEDGRARSGDSVPRDGRRRDLSDERSGGIGPCRAWAVRCRTGNSLVVSQFHSALLHQLLIVLLVVVACAVAFNVIRTVQYRRLKADGLSAFPTSGPSVPEPLARRVLRYGFGGLWILDGLLQIQASMPLGLPSGVIESVRQQLTGVGPAPREQRRDHLVRPPRAGGGGHRLDPGRAGRLAAGGSARPVVPPRGRGDRRLGSRRLDVRRVLRGDLRSGADMALRRARRRALLLRRRRPHRAARARLRHPASGADRPRVRGRVPHRDGTAPGVARSRHLAGTARDSSAPWSRRCRGPRSRDSSPRGSARSPPSTPPTVGA